MNKTKALMLLWVSIILSVCSYGQIKNIKVENKTNLEIKDGLVTVNIPSKMNGLTLKQNGIEVPYQIKEENGKKILLFTADLKAKEKKQFVLLDDVKGDKVFKSRTHAELSMKTEGVYFDKRFRGSKFEKVTRIKVPSIHTDHDALFKYEGPGWESEKVGYRFYLDWRNATDIFGKKYNKLVLENVGTHDTVAKDDSYHSMLDWGMDIFKVGSTLGIGSIGMWSDGKVNMVSKTDSVYCSIPYTGPVEAKVLTEYYGWNVNGSKYDLTAVLSIAAGSRLTKCELDISKNAENIVTGLAKYPGTEFFKSENKKGWNYIALYGKQTLVNENDKLGIVVFYKEENKKELLEDKLSYIVKLKPIKGKVTYYFGAAWEQEENGIKTIEEFKKYVEETLIQLNSPLIVKTGK